MKLPVPSPRRQLRMLTLLRAGLVVARPDHPVLLHLERRRCARAVQLLDPRSGKPTSARAWKITSAGVDAAATMALPVSRRRRSTPREEQIDLEDAIASASSGDRPDAVPLPDTDAPAVPAADVSAPLGRSSRSALAAAKPEHAHA